ncbi:MAG: extracellular solute-binding protein [candidate division NC10 bacterium]|nr:extracellular solute-binding protein [candidate division NC10 bacterium]
MTGMHSISRRGFLKGVAAAAGAGLGPAILTRSAQAQTRTLQIWHTEASDISVKAVQKVCDRFEQMHPGAKANQQGIAWADLGPKLYTALAAGTPPDIAHLNCYHFRSFQKQGAIVPIDDVYRAIGLNDVVESVRDMTLFQGKRWGISHHVGAPALMIRKDIAEQAGFKVPDDISKPMFPTWKEQLEYLKAVSKPDKRQWGMSLPGTGYFLQEHLGRWVGSNGGTFYDEKWNPAFHKEPFIQTLEFVKALSREVRPGQGLRGVLRAHLEARGPLREDPVHGHGRRDLGDLLQVQAPGPGEGVAQAVLHPGHVPELRPPVSGAHASHPQVPPQRPRIPGPARAEEVAELGSHAGDQHRPGAGHPRGCLLSRDEHPDPLPGRGLRFGDHRGRDRRLRPGTPEGEGGGAADHRSGQ